MLDDQAISVQLDDQAISVQQLLSSTGPSTPFFKNGQRRGHPLPLNVASSLIPWPTMADS